MNTSATYRLLVGLLFIAAIHFYVAGARDISAGSPDKTDCGEVCAIGCLFGNVLDEKGCPTCKCNRCPPVPTVKPEICARARFASNCKEDKDCNGTNCCENDCGNLMCTKRPEPNEPVPGETGPVPGEILEPNEPVPGETGPVPGETGPVPGETNQCPSVSGVLPDHCAFTTYIQNCKQHSDCTSGQCCLNECSVLMCNNPPDVCSLPADSGPCEAAFKRWHFNSTAGQCMIFIWGGCQGNANNFEDEGLCQDKCDIKQPVVDPPPYEPVPEDECPALSAYVPDYCRTSRYAAGCSEHKNCSGGLCCPDQCGILMCNTPTEPKDNCDDSCLASPCCKCHHINNQSACACAGIAPGSRGCFFGSCSSNPCLFGEKCVDMFGDDRSYICQKECPVINCGDCKSGCTVDEDGCNICAYDPCATVQCSDDKVCEFHQIYCVTTPCVQPEPKCVPKGCPLRKCTKNCDFGYEKDDDGCDGCTCLPSPCATALCPPGQVCQPKNVTCDQARCPVEAECVPQANDGQFKCPPVEAIGCVNFTYPVECKLNSDSDSGCGPGQICCAVRCGGAKCFNTSTQIQTESDVCSLPAETGPCKALSLRWHFNTGAGICITFTWGGCQGNANNFVDEASCQAKCGNKSPIVDPPPEQVDQPPSYEKGGEGQGSQGNSGPDNSQSSPGDNGGAERDGKCPADRVRRKYHTDVTCSSDDGCPGNKKCCSRAGAKVCRTPDAPKAGTCPNVKRKLNSGKPVAMKCDSDAECCDNLKCCETTTGGFDCAEPVAAPAPKQDARCPEPQPGEVGICGFTCTLGTVCIDGGFCCKTACGGSSCVPV